MRYLVPTSIALLFLLGGLTACFYNSTLAATSPLPENCEIWAGWINADGKRVEKKSAAQWIVVKLKKPDGNIHRIEITIDELQRLNFVSAVDGVGTLPQRIRFGGQGGGANQVLLELIPEEP